MKPIPFIRDAVLGGICVTIIAVTASGQNPVAPPAQTDAVEQPRQQRATPPVRRRANRIAAGNLDARTVGDSIRASKLIGMAIENPEGKNVGSIHDLVLDSKSGKVRYAAVSYGGFLGVGDKLFAVPFEAFKYQKDGDSPDTYVLVLNVTQNQLEGAQGFDEEHWPNFADRQITDDIDKRYGIDRRLRNRDADVDVNVSPNGVDIDVDSAKPDSPKPE